MKKIAISALTLSLLLPSLSVHAQVTPTKPSELKVGNKDYSAVMLKDTKVMIRNSLYNSKQNIKTIKAGTKVTITKHKLVRGYNYLVLKGNYYMPVDDENIKITKPSNTSIEYNESLSGLAVKRLNEAKNKKYYSAYKEYTISKDYIYKHWIDNKEISIMLTLVGGDGMIEDDANGLMTYKDWIQSGKPSKEVYSKPKEDTAKIDFTSKQFIKEYVNSKENIVRGHKAGDILGKVNNDYRVSRTFNTTIGEFDAGNNAAYQGARKGSKIVATKLIYAPKDGVSYYAIKRAYGKPVNSTLTRKHIVEHILKYDKSKYGYDLYVVFDSYKGNLKYMYKTPVKK